MADAPHLISIPVEPLGIRHFTGKDKEFFFHAATANWKVSFGDCSHAEISSTLFFFSLIENH